MASKIEQLHFLLVPLMSQSHIIPLTDFAKLLARRGVFVSIVTTPLNAIRYKGVIDHAKAQDLKIQMIPIKFPCQEVGLPEGCENLDALDSMGLAWKIFRACDMLQAPWKADGDTEPFLLPDIPHKIEFTRAQLPTHRRPTVGSEEYEDQPIPAKVPARATLVNSFEELEPGTWMDIERKKERSGALAPFLSAIRNSLRGLLEETNPPLTSITI
ncbi:UNVERIFIED_CONTAM: UDP-glycosyltransferase 73C3 [Sesamum radiatum]|uniref:UDP-glycosyltransferase 73C3 n=1 Tax=Sesamum radiatum TaxID=300843 RepID=A0AAW2LC23_SESRA